MMRSKFGARDSPLLPYHTGSRLPSTRRPSKASSTFWRLLKFSIFLLILVAGVYTLTNSSQRGKVTAKASTERSGRTLAEHESLNASRESSDTRRSSNVPLETEGDVAPPENIRLPGLRSHAGREEVLESQTHGGEQISHQSPVGLNGSMGEQAVQAVNTIVQPIVGQSKPVVNAVSQAANTLQQSAGQVDPAAKLVTSTENSPDAIYAETTAQTAQQNTPETNSANIYPATGLYSMRVNDIDGQEVPLSQYSGKVSLVVNVASQCGFTDSNYKGLNQLYEKFKTQGFEILAFPCNSWNQESGSANEISSFARTQYGAKFPLFAKVDAIGENAHPVMRWLTNNLPGSGWTPKWNFSKWLVNQQGMPVKSYDSTFDFDRLSFDIEAELLKGTSQRQSQGLKR